MFGFCSHSAHASTCGHKDIDDKCCQVQFTISYNVASSIEKNDQFWGLVYIMTMNCVSDDAYLWW